MTQPIQQEGQAPSRGMWVKVAIFAVLLVGGFLVLRYTPLAEYVHEEKLKALFDSLAGYWWAPLFLVLLYTVLAPLGMPMTPLLIAGGAVFGFAYGALYNCLGMLFGGTLSYLLARSLGRDFVVHVTGGRIRQAEAIFNRHGFWPLVQSRFMPIPYALANFAIALTGVRLPLFLVTTVLGIIPAGTVYTYFWAKIFRSAGDERWAAIVQLAVVVVIMNVIVGFPSIRAALRARKKAKENRQAAAG